MADDITSLVGGLFSLLFRGLWALTKIFYRFLKQHPRYACLLPSLLVAAYFRFSYVFSSTAFLGINPDDLHLVTTLSGGTLILLGSLLDPGHITLGPFYDYLIALPILLLGSDPVFPAFLAGVIAIATVYLIYIIGKQFFNLQAGLFAAGLYAISTFTISYVHLSWNIDLLPFFSVLLLWIIFNAAARARPLLHYLLAGLVLGLCLQLHYVALFLVIFVLFYMIVTEIIVKGRVFFIPFLLHFVELLGGFFISSLPFLYYEVLKGFPNSLALENYLLKIAHSITFSHLLVSLLPMSSMLFARLIVHFPSPDIIPYYSITEVTFLTYFAAVLLAVSVLTLFFARNRFIIIVILLWLLFGVFSFSFFQKDIYDYHFSLLYPVYFLLVGNFLATIFHLGDQERIKMAKQLISHTTESETYTMIPVDATDNKKLAIHAAAVGVSILLFFTIVLFNLSILPYHYQTKAQESKIKDIAAFVIDKDSKTPFNFALLTPPNTSVDPSVYANELSKLGNKPITIQHPEIDPEKKTITDFLYVVCEESDCKPLESTLWSIKGFGNAAVLDHWGVADVTVYKLVHVIQH